MVRYDSFESTFALIMLNLNLEEGKRNRLLVKPTPYTFVASQALELMKDTNFKLYFGNNFTEISICVPEKSTKPLLQKYLNAHLIHCPSERRIATITARTALQITAKGVAVIETFCNDFSVEHSYKNTLFKSSLNTMKLLRIPRDPVSTHVQISEALLMVLWNRMLGAQPHAFSPSSKKDPSPYWHQWLLHPHGDSVSQYYNADGIRLFKDVSFKVSGTKDQYVLDYVLSGRGIYQWVLDCTDVMHPADAELIAKMFVSREYVRMVTDTLCDGITSPDNFPQEISRTTIYRIAHRGHLMCRWSDILILDHSLVPAPHWTSTISFTAAPIATLDDIFQDPGLVMLFELTIARLHASENIDFLRELQEVYDIFDPAVNGPSSRDAVLANWQHLVGIVYRYISISSPKEVNIPPKMRCLILEAIPDGQITYNEILVRVGVLTTRLDAAREHIRGLLEAMIPHFLNDPVLDQFPLISKMINPAPVSAPLKCEKFDRSKLSPLAHSGVKLELLTINRNLRLAAQTQRVNC